MKTKISQKSAAVLAVAVREMIASVSLNPSARGQVLVNAIPAEERALVGEELINAYLELDVVA